MEVKIGHASKDENGKASGGKAGDSTKKEVCVRNWYNGGWGFLARPKDPKVAEKIAAACEAGCANDKIGYDQSGRNTLLHEAKEVGFDLSKITTPCECDCSSFVTCCVMAGGIQIWSGGNAPTTRTLRRVLHQSGAFDILTDARYLTGPDRVCRGDILCKEDSHTVICLTDGKDAQRPVEEPQKAKNKIRSGATYSVELPLVQRGDTGAIVETIQRLLGLDPADVDGDFGPRTEATVMAYQKGHGLSVDGQVGGQTWRTLVGM